MGKKIEQSVWDKMKADWLTGLYTLKSLSERYKVSEIAVRVHSAKEKWANLKNHIQEKAQKKIEEKAIDRLSRLGYSMDEHFRGLVNGMRNSSITMLYNKRKYKIADHRTRLEYQKELDKIMGLHAPVKQESKITERLEIAVVGDDRQGLELDSEEKETFDNPDEIPADFTVEDEEK